jgi:hypothetical protein
VFLLADLANCSQDISPVSFAIDPALLARSLSTLGAVRSAIGYDGSDIAAISPLFDKLEHPPPMAPPRLRRRGDSQISASVSSLQEIPEADELLIGDEDHDADDEAFTNDNYSAKESLTGSAGKRSRSVSFSGSNASSCTWADPVNESPIIPEHLRGPAFNADFERMMLDLPLPPMDSVPIVRTRARTLSSSGTEGTRPRIKLNDGPQETGFEKFRGHVKKKAKVLLNACHGNDAE